jgi:hypothetical protein
MPDLTRFIKFFDIYGNYFQLRINNQTKFKTVLGGIFSLLTLIILVLCVLSFGNDFFNRTNPKISIEEGLYQDSEIPVLNGTEYPTKPAIIMVPKTFSNQAKLKVSVTTANNTYASTYLNECNQTHLNEFFPEVIGTDIQTLYCFNFNEYRMSLKSLLYFTYDECKSIKADVLAEFDKNNITCLTTGVASLPTLQLSFYTKQLGFKPDEAKPFINKTVSYSLSLTNNYYTYVNIYWSLQFLSDDIGWFVDSKSEYMDINPTQQTMQQNSVTASGLPKFRIYFFVTDKFKRYNRTFQKLQDVLAALGGFMKLILTMLNLISMLIRAYSIDLYIIDEKFETEKKLVELEVNRTAAKNMDNSSNSNYKFNLELQNNYVKVKTPNILQVKHSERISLCTYTKALLLNFCNCSESKRKDSLLNMLRKKIKVVNSFQDYSYIMKKLHEFEIMKNVFLNEKQLLCFDYLSKPYACETDPSLSRSFSVLFNAEQMNRESLVSYYSGVLAQSPINDYDEKIFRYLNNEIKEEILSKINK